MGGGDLNSLRERKHSNKGRTHAGYSLFPPWLESILKIFCGSVYIHTQPAVYGRLGAIAQRRGK